MEDLTLALVTLTSFVLLFVVAIFADRAGAEMELPTSEQVPAPLSVDAALPAMEPAVALTAEPAADVA